ncbi:MAG: aminopeptidase [Marmoricola sp.]|nr:aminopeptidase [Marmoricola sp.]
MSTMPEHDRVRALVDAEHKALALFDEVVARGLVAVGTSERELSDQIRELANELFDVQRFWHKRIVRSGINTLEPYRSNPPDLTIGADDIVFFDFGPIFDQWEADVGRTYVVGDDPRKHRLTADLGRIWTLAKQYFDARPDITGAELFAHVLELIADAGWKHGASHAGHLVGEFPHEKINGDEIDCYVTHGSTGPMRRPDAAGKPCHWILEIHLIEPGGRFGGFYEQLLDLPSHRP